jgi:primosomal replication protein N
VSLVLEHSRVAMSMKASEAILSVPCRLPVRIVGSRKSEPQHVSILSGLWLLCKLHPRLK